MVFYFYDKFQWPDIFFNIILKNISCLQELKSKYNLIEFVTKYEFLFTSFFISKFWNKVIFLKLFLNVLFEWIKLRPVFLKLKNFNESQFYRFANENILENEGKVPKFPKISNFFL
jgi:hypothetical protein